MPETPREQAVAEQLRRAGARFAFVHGSRATGEHTRPDSDLDVAAWWGNGAPDAWTVALPAAVDLLVLDGAPLWLAGRVALRGRLLFDDDPPARVAWQADTRLVYLDELPGILERQRGWREAIARVDRERVTRLLDQVRADVDRLRAFAKRDPDELLADDTAMNAMKYCFVTSIEGCTRVAHHLNVSEGWSAPDTNAAAFRETGTRGVIARDMGEALAEAAGFRNVLVHRYTEVDDRRVVDHLGRVGDLDLFVTEVASWLDTEA